jgi:hypothetical protein
MLRPGKGLVRYGSRQVGKASSINRLLQGWVFRSDKYDKYRFMKGDVDV